MKCEASNFGLDRVQIALDLSNNRDESVAKRT
jgi:hypothetical protein